MVRDEEDVKKKTAQIPGSGFRRIKKNGLIESKCPFTKEHEKNCSLVLLTLHLCVILRPLILVFVCVLNVKFSGVLDLSLDNRG